jgi:hypothetical protein
MAAGVDDFAIRGNATLPLGGGGLSALAPEGAKRLRRLRRKGEGVTAEVWLSLDRVTLARGDPLTLFL